MIPWGKGKNHNPSPRVICQLLSYLPASGEPYQNPAFYLPESPEHEAGIVWYSQAGLTPDPHLRSDNGTGQNPYSLVFLALFRGDQQAHAFPPALLLSAVVLLLLPSSSAASPAICLLLPPPPSLHRLPPSAAAVSI